MRRLSGIIIALALIAGCSNSSQSPTARTRDASQWNDARANVLIGLARDQYINGKFEECGLTINEAIKLAPNSSPARVLSAKRSIEIGQLEAAERELTLARQLDATNSEAEYLLGVVYQRWQQPERALEFYQAACDKSPAEIAYLIAKAEMLVSMDRRVEALDLLESKLIYFEHSAVIRDEVGLLLIQEKRFDEAVEMVRRACVLSTDDLVIREHLAMALYYARRFQESAEVLTALLKEGQFSRRADLLMTLGQCQLQAGQPQNALPNFQTAADIMPGSAEAWLGLAQCELQLNDPRRAEMSLRQSLVQDPREGQAYLLLGYLRLRQDRNDDAVMAFTRAGQLDPGDSTCECMLGYALEKLGRTREALACFSRALKASPNDEMARGLMASIDLHE